MLTFFQAYLVTLSTTGKQLIFRVARRYMPKLKTLSEVATVRWLREVSNDTSDTVRVHSIFNYLALADESM